MLLSIVNLDHAAGKNLTRKHGSVKENYGAALKCSGKGPTLRRFYFLVQDLKCPVF